MRAEEVSTWCAQVQFREVNWLLFFSHLTSHIKQIINRKWIKNKPLQWFSLFFYFWMDKQPIVVSACTDKGKLGLHESDCMSNHVEMNMSVLQILVIHPIIQIIPQFCSSTIFWKKKKWIYKLQVHGSAAPYAVIS